MKKIITQYYAKKFCVDENLLINFLSKSVTCKRPSLSYTLIQHDTHFHFPAHL